MFYFINNEKLHGPYDLSQIKLYFEKNMVNSNTKFFIKTDNRLKPVNLSSMVPDKEFVTINAVKNEPASQPIAPPLTQMPQAESVFKPSPPTPKRIVKANTVSKPKINYVGKTASNTKNFFQNQWKGVLVGIAITFAFMLVASNRNNLFSGWPSFGGLFETRLERTMREEMEKYGKNLRDNWDKSFDENNKDRKRLNEKFEKSMDEGMESQRRWGERFDRNSR